jgi:DNA invertase Pin-like site-specific DNA recombinase
LLIGLLLFMMKGDFGESQRMAHGLLPIATDANVPAQLLTAHAMIGVISFWVGKLQTTAAHLDQAIAVYETHPDANQGIVGCFTSGAWTLWHLGFPDQALERAQRAQVVAKQLAYDDGGLSGGTMERPALHRLLNDIEEGRVDVIVVYKVDRLTRSLADFAKMVEVFDGHGVSFVAVTQQFNTTTSMGRLTLNVLLSFAQFEREVTGERIRDKIAASKKKGMWMGGFVPVGYVKRDRRLAVDEEQAETVRLIFRRYSELRSVRLLKQDLDRRGLVSKIRTGKNGAQMGGKAYSRGKLYKLLSNPIYKGEIRHLMTCHPVNTNQSSRANSGRRYSAFSLSVRCAVRMQAGSQLPVRSRANFSTRLARH